MAALAASHLHTFTFAFTLDASHMLQDRQHHTQPLTDLLTLLLPTQVTTLHY